MPTPLNHRPRKPLKRVKGNPKDSQLPVTLQEVPVGISVSQFPGLKDFLANSPNSLPFHAPRLFPLPRKPILPPQPAICSPRSQPSSPGDSSLKLGLPNTRAGLTALMKSLPPPAPSPRLGIFQVLDLHLIVFVAQRPSKGPHTRLATLEICRICECGTHLSSCTVIPS